MIRVKIPLLTKDVPLPDVPLSPAKDPGDYPIFTGGISRWVWRIYVQRLTVAGRWVAFVSGAFISYSGAGLQLQGYVVGSYFAAVWVVAGLGLLWWRPRVKLRASLAERASVGTVLPVEVEVENQSGWKGLDLVVLPHRLGRWVDCVPEAGVMLPSLGKGEKAVAKMGLRCQRRGVFTLRGFRVESGFPFGLLRSRQVFHESRKLVVYPSFSPLGRLTLPTGRRYQPGGVALASELGESFEYLGNREFREGDNVRDIDWRATARLGGTTPVVREWVEEYMLRVAVVLDTQVPGWLTTRQKEGRREDFERAVSIAAAAADYMARQDYLVDVFAAGPELYHLTAGRSLAYLEQILDILANVEAVEDESREPFSVIEPRLAELIERISTVIFVVLDFDEPRRRFAEGLARQGVAVKVIVVKDGRPGLDPALSAAGSEAAHITREQFEMGVTEV